MILLVTGSRDAGERHAKKIILPMSRSYTLAAEVAAGEPYEIRGWVLGESRGTLGCLRLAWDAQLEATVRGLG